MCSRYQCTTLQLSNLVGQYSSSIVYYKTPIKYGENTHNRRVFMHTNTPSVTIQGNITAMRFRNDAIRWILLLHIRANLGMMLTLDNASCPAARSTLVKLVANTCKHPDGLQSLDLNPIDQISGSSSVLFLRSVRPFHNSIFIDTCYQRVHVSLLWMRHQVDVQSIETKLMFNTTCFDFADFCLKGVPVNSSI